MSQAFGRDAGSAVSPLPEGFSFWQLSRPPLVARRIAGGPARAPQAAATEGLYERHAAKILGYCLHQLGSREEAEDAVQTTFMNAFRALGRGVVPEAESAWLFKIAENVCLSRRRSSWRRGRIESPSDFDVIEEVVPGPSRQRDELIGIEDALASMPEQQRRAILLREWQGLSYREISDELELSQSAVETLIFRARRSLAQGLEQPDLLKQPKRKSFRRADAHDRPRHGRRRSEDAARRQRRRQGDRRRSRRHGRGDRCECDARSSRATRRSPPGAALSLSAAATPTLRAGGHPWPPARVPRRCSRRDRSGRRARKPPSRPPGALRVRLTRVRHRRSSESLRSRSHRLRRRRPRQRRRTPSLPRCRLAEPVAQPPVNADGCAGRQPSHVEPAPVEPAIVDQATPRQRGARTHAPLEPAPEIQSPRSLPWRRRRESSIAPVPEPVVAPIVAATLPVQPAPTPHHPTGELVGGNTPFRRELCGVGNPQRHPTAPGCHHGPCGR